MVVVNVEAVKGDDTEAIAAMELPAALCSGVVSVGAVKEFPLEAKVPVAVMEEFPASNVS